MRIFFCFFLFCFSILPAYGQQVQYEFSPFTITINGDTFVIKSDDEITGTKMYFHPEEYLVDLDSDSLDEFIVIDHKGDSTDYTIYIYNTLDSLYIADSIKSGFYQPYFTYSDETEEMIIVTGNEEFLRFQGSEGNFLPVNCYKFDSGELFNINDEIYDAFITENELISDFIDSYFNENPKDCNSTKKIISAISAAYCNYINAGETTLANQLLAEFDFCGDMGQLKKQFDDLIEKQQRESK